MGRPSKISEIIRYRDTPDGPEGVTRAEEILNYLRLGLSQEDAATMGGVSESTFYRWRERGEAASQLHDEGIEVPEDEEPYREFWETLTRARVEGEAYHVRIIRDAGMADWRASAWFLERSQPAKYGRRDRLEVITPERLDEEIERIVAELRRRAEQGDVTAAKALDEMREE